VRELRSTCKRAAPRFAAAAFSQALSELADASRMEAPRPSDACLRAQAPGSVAVDAGTERRQRDSPRTTTSGGDVTRTAAKATAAAVVVVAIAFGLWKVRTIICS